MKAVPADSLGVAYTMVAHACRFCGGRVRQHGDTYRCSGCPAVTMYSPIEICGCGVLQRPGANRSSFHCIANPARSAQSPSEIVIAFDDDVLLASPERRAPVRA